MPGVATNIIDKRLNSFSCRTAIHQVFRLFFANYASYELHQMKEEDLSFTNMCHLLIIIVTEFFFWDALYNEQHCP